MKESGRQDWQSFFMDLAFFWAQRSTCTRRKVGAIAVIDKRVISSGYNGAVAGHSHCTIASCVRTVQNIPSGEKLDVCRAVHAEQNLIIQAAQFGVSMKNSIVYCTTMPCHTCLKLLLNVGVSKIFYAGDYDSETIRQTLQEDKNAYLLDRCVRLQNTANSPDYSMWTVAQTQL